MAAAAGVRLNKSFYDKKGRLKKVPGMVDSLRNVDGRRFSAQVILEYQEGLRRNNLRLKRLQPRTLKQKKLLNYKRPKSPLVALGDEHRDTLINALQVRVIKVKSVGRTLFVVGPSRRLHHRRVVPSASGGHRLKRTGPKGPPLNKLVSWHERGVVINNGFGKGIRIVIPPRPAVTNAWKRAKRKLSALRRGKEIKFAVGTVVMKGRKYKGLWALTPAQKKALQNQGGVK